MKYAPVTTTVIVATLAIGIGANVTMVGAIATVIGSN
jgi:hypothetical protein